MGRWIDIETAHGGVLGWRADPETQPLGALVVVQEIFGVNAHMREVVDRFAGEGFVAVAPAMFDPVARGVELGYDQAGFTRGRALVAELGFDRAIDLVAATARILQADGDKVGVVGFCWGGSVAFLANTRLGLPAVSYYGARTVPFLDEPLRAPMLFHFGSEDDSTPAADIALHREKQPQAEVHVYPAGHAFNRDVDPASFQPESAGMAMLRTLDFLRRHLR